MGVSPRTDGHPATAAITWSLSCPSESSPDAGLFKPEPWALVLHELQLCAKYHARTSHTLPHPVLPQCPLRRVLLSLLTDEGTKALRGGKIHLGSCLKHYTGITPFLLTTPLTDSEKLPGVVNLDKCPACLVITLSRAKRAFRVEREKRLKRRVWTG